MSKVTFESVLIPIIKDGALAESLRKYDIRTAKEIHFDFTMGITTVRHNIGTIVSFITHSKQPDGSYKLYTIPYVLYKFIDMIENLKPDETHCFLRALNLFGISGFKRQSITAETQVAEGEVKFFDGNEWWKLSCNTPLPATIPDRTLFMNDNQVRFAINKNPENDFNNHILAQLCRNYFHIRMASDTSPTDVRWYHEGLSFKYKDLLTCEIRSDDMTAITIDFKWNEGYIISMVEYYMAVNEIKPELLIADRNYPLRIEFISVGMCEPFLALGVEGLYVYKYEEGMDTSRCYVAGEYCFELLNFAIHK